MKISIDGGGLCVPAYKRYGNYIFTLNLINALSAYDKENSYSVYSFCSRPANLMLSSNSFYKVIKPKLFWMKLRVSLEEMLAKKDIFLALNQAIPLFTSARVIGFSHGLSFMQYPGYYKDSYQKMRRQMETLMARADCIFVSSKRVRDEIVELFPKSKTRISVAVYGIPYDMTEPKERTRQNYFVFSGMNHPVKNVKFLVDAFIKFISKKEFRTYKLYLIGPFASYRKRSKQVQSFPQMSRDEIREMFRKARGYVTASLYESFNFPVLEALSQNCPVVGMDTAIIPELKQYVYSAYNEDQFIDMLEQVAHGKEKKEHAKDIREVFSWQSYVSSLTSVYNK